MEKSSEGGPKGPVGEGKGRRNNRERDNQHRVGPPLWEENLGGPRHLSFAVALPEIMEWGSNTNRNLRKTHQARGGLIPRWS